MEQERQEENQELTKKISPYKIIYPIIIGLAVVSYMLYKEFDPKAFDLITFTWSTVFWLFVAGYSGFRICDSNQDSIGRKTKLVSVSPNYIPLGIHLGSDPFRYRRYQPSYSFRA